MPHMSQVTKNSQAPQSLIFNPKVIGHRGACAYAPENTLSSFIKAAQLGVKWVEFDVMQTSTGEAIIFHDETLDRTTNAQGKVSHFPLTYIQSLDAGSWFDPVFSGERVPTLLSVIHFLQEAKMSANIELKSQPGQEKKLVKQVLHDMQPFLQSANHRFIFSSFSIDTLYCLRENAGSCQLGLIIHEWLPEWQTLMQPLNCISIHVNHQVMTEERARLIKKSQKILLCYTVNQAERAKELYSWGVDAVFSDNLLIFN